MIDTDEPAESGTPPEPGTPSTSAQPTRPRRGLFGVIAVVTTCLLAAGALAVTALRSDGDSSRSGDGSDAHAGHEDAGHGGHSDEAVLDGCDPVEYHNTMMMFDPTAADTLLDSGCPWPYDATIAVDGGAEDPTIAAVYEPRRYAEVFDLIDAERYGMCAVKRLPDASTNGFVFGFEVALNAAGCADGISTFDVAMREYASRGWRDAAAAVAVDELAGAGDVIVLGRWVVSVSGADRSAVEAFGSLLAGLGGVPIGA